MPPIARKKERDEYGGIRRMVRIFRADPKRRFVHRKKIYFRPPFNLFPITLDAIWKILEQHKI